MTPTVTDTVTTSAEVTVDLTPIQSISVREKPPLRLAHLVETPNGRRYRWADDEPDPANVPSGVRFSSTMPGGFESHDCVLPRKPSVDYADLERLSTITTYGPGGEIAGEFRVEGAPRTSGGEVAVSPRSVGWQAHLEDDRSASMLYVARDLARFGDVSQTRKLALLTGGWAVEQSSVSPDITTGLPSIEQLIPSADGGTRSIRPLCDIAYDTGSRVASVYYELQTTTNVTASFQAYIQAHTDDSYAAGEQSADIITATNALFTGTYTPATPRRVITLTYYYDGTTGFVNELPVYWRRLALFGDHGLTKRGAVPDQGLWASDIVAHAVGKWAPLLNVQVSPSAFVIPHMVFPEPTTAGEIVRQATRFGLQDWGVWENRTFRWHERGAGGRRWKARAGPTQLEETGPQLERLWESIVVAYPDVDGSTKTVGPPGSGADVESDLLKDPDPENPANQLGIVRRDLLQIGVNTPAGAVEVGRRFLAEQKLLDSSGRARFVGHVEDDRGVLHAAWKVRAGDHVSFADSNDTSWRRVVRADYDHPSRTCSVDLDSPPEGLAQLLERLGASLVPLGL